MSSQSRAYQIGGIITVFLGAIVGLSLTPTINTLVTAAVASMDAGAAKSLAELIPLFWVIFLTAIPVGSIVIYVTSRARQGEMDIGDIIAVFLPMVVGLSLTDTVVDSVNSTAGAMAAGAAKTLLTLFPMFWVIYLIGIPVSAIAVYFYVKSHE